mmetsp:Transcript_32538/g.44660  ORF Transcript_32538/g.44660 Transcript_32538/m.44660 type:complete len:228 (+) Transcript_32538:76-759(+)|eukprot:CAMPEP_0201490504 /NCGR_PEP_ID=MMETSP0151_2-20130828/26596_1 /ASSEMBLY_ACC=CAM_ASM_000257 /TAXON_ID=200890 /ORGANISM="Paramoeba atlantica, Strain 621/1 / CCAP 1560/9" /LENGTH=227 /DNA_ID=CAMNT_0047876491 /DNA_START=76 /DNA_END=759 /DNA_ORIENTATION=-
MADFFGGINSHSSHVEMEHTTEEVLEYASSLPKIDKRDSDERTVLHWAAAMGRVDVVKGLLALRADPTTEDDSGWSPLISAASAGHVEVLSLFLPLLSPEDICAVTSHQRSALFYAASKARVEVMKMLLPASVPVINKGEKSSLNTPLHRAAATGSKEAVNLLLEHHAKVSSRNKYRETPLQVAIQEDFVEIAKILLDKGALKFEEMDELVPLVKNPAFVRLIKEYQ